MTQLRADPVSVKSREAQTRSRQRRKLEQAGLPIPPELQKRPTGPPARRTEEEKRQQQNASAARYRDTHPDEIKEATRLRIARNKGIVAEIKNHPCMDCGLKFPPVCMDFDHREGEVKWGGYRGGVAGLMQNGSVETLLAEIEKCDLVCANCHRIRTHQPMKEDNEQL